jgi:transcriptional regulator with XRE-family HTH domain
VARAAGDDLTSAPPHLAERVGGRIRARRTLLGQTLTQTAKAAEVSVSHLSSIETGANLPSLPILARVAAALGLTLNEVLRDVGGGGSIRVERVDGGSPARQPLSHDGLQLFIAALACGDGEAGESPIQAEGAELFVYVLDGALEVTVDETTTVLNAGDSLDADEAHAASWRAAGRARTGSIWARGPLKDA